MGLVYHNGALQTDTQVPGLHFNPKRYLGAKVEMFGVLEDVDCFGCNKLISVKSKEGTQWKVAVNVANQVRGEDAVKVVRAQGRDYDMKMGRLMPSVLKEVFAPLSNLEIRKDKATDLNEMVAAELRAQMAENWGKKIASLIAINYVTLEHIECSDNQLRRQWDEQVSEDAKRVTTQMKARTEAAEHARQQAAVEAQAARDRAATDAKNARARADAEAEAERGRIANQVKIDAAVADAEAAAIAAKQQLDAAKAQAELVKSFPEAAAHKERLEGFSALRKNEKLSTVYMPGDAAGGIKAAGVTALFDKLSS